MRFGPSLYHEHFLCVLSFASFVDNFRAAVWCEYWRKTKSKQKRTTFMQSQEMIANAGLHWEYRKNRRRPAYDSITAFFPRPTWTLLILCCPFRSAHRSHSCFSICLSKSGISIGQLESLWAIACVQLLCERMCKSCYAQSSSVCWWTMFV